jgi:hypothetical protein
MRGHASQDGLNAPSCGDTRVRVGVAGEDSEQIHGCVHQVCVRGVHVQRLRYPRSAVGAKNACLVCIILRQLP